MSYKKEKNSAIIIRDKKRRACVIEYEIERKLLRAIVRDLRLSIEIRQSAQKSLAALPRDSNFVRLNRRCTITGRGRGVSKRFKISRIALRNTVSNGRMIGVHQSSW